MARWIIASPSEIESALAQREPRDADSPEPSSVARETPPTSPDGPRFAWWESSRAGVFSAVCHAVVLIALAQLSTAPQGNTVVRTITAQSMSPLTENSVEALDALLDVPLDAMPLQVDLQFSSSQLAGDPEQPVAFDIAQVSEAQFVGGASEADLLASVLAEDGAGGSGKNTSGGRDGLGASGETAGNGKANTNNGKSASFFGVEASGERFVFVVDLSGSMEGRRIIYAIRELRKSLSHLTPDQSYFVIFFNTDSFPMPAGDLVKATSANLAKTRRWIAEAQCSGLTNPGPALRLAVELDPDAVFFLTDGEFEPEVVEMIEPASSSDSLKIHTIAFQSRAGEELMQAIAKKTRGTYRFVE